MTQISLRAYIREIDNLIERELLDEAIAHCRHILQTYPKHIETYRLLGKSYLEAKRYGDAADIFQRVLSAVPDDFVSHIGMAIVREDEGNLDSAIWHMERAFETNPANPAIQQELRRLIGRRDGFEPHKVRLTRGALARMYAQGELYPQAIAELQSALQEDADRPDLQVLLAEMLWQTDQKMEAAEVSRQILEKLPYCQKAGRIMAAVHQEQGKSDEGTAYHRRLAQLDPYAAYVEYPMVDTVKVEADTIRIERLDWRPGQPLPASESAQPDWASSLGVEIEGDSDEAASSGPLPSWLDDIEPSAKSLEIDDGQDQGPQRASPFESPSLEDNEASFSDEAAEADIPEWMSEAGWEQSSGEAVETPVSFSESELSALERGELPAAAESADELAGGDSQDLAPAEIPSWLQERAPASDTPPTTAAHGEQAGGVVADDSAPDWMAGLGEPANSADEAASDEGDLTPDWLGEIATGDEDLDMDATLPSFDTAEEDATIEAGAATARAADPGDVPAWLDDSEPGATSTIMTWLGSRDDEEAPQASEADEETEGVPDWMAAAMAADDDAEVAPPPADEPVEAPPAWLSGLAQAAAESDDAEFDELTQLRAQSVAAQEEDSGTEEPEAQPGEIPDWLTAITSDEGPGELPTDDVFEAELPESFPWEADQADVGQTAADPASDVRDVESGEETIRTGSVPSAEHDMPADIPGSDSMDAANWLESLSQATEEDTEHEVWPSADDSTPEPASGSATSWLENLGQADDEPPARADLSEEEPEWMRGLGDEDTDDEAIGDLASTWLEGLADTLAETPAEPDDAAAPTGDDVPNWLHDYDASQADADQTPAEAPAPEDLAPESEIDEPPAAEADTGRLKLLEELGLQDSETSDETLAAGSEGTEQESYDLGQLEGMDDDQIFGWLEGLAARDTDASPGDSQSGSTDSTPESSVEGDEPAMAPGADTDADLGWLAQLAEQRGLAGDVEAATAGQRPSAPAANEPAEEAHPEPIQEQPPEPAEPYQSPPPKRQEEWPPAAQQAEPEPPSVPEPQSEPEPAPAEDVPDWLGAPQVSAEAETPASESPSEAAPEPRPVQVAEPEPEPQTEATPDATPAAPVEPAAAAVDDGLERARQALESGHIDRAVNEYGLLIKARRSLSSVVEDLEAALDQDAESSALWQVLGDAYMKSDRTSEAVKAYNRGMKEAEVLNSARQALASGDAQRAAAQYGILIKGKKRLDDVLQDLENALAQDADQPIIWQILGDAYMKADRLDESIEAYRKGMSSV